MLGISKYKPNFYNNAELFKDAFNETLLGLIGKKIDRFWVMWNTKDDEWVADSPIILEIDGKRYEFTAYNLDEFSLTINSFKLTDKLNWYGSGNEMPLIWKENGHPRLIKNLHKPILGVNILTFNLIPESLKSSNKDKTENLLFGIEFILEKETESDYENFFSIFNALDQNGMDNAEIKQENQIQRLKII